jgi:hypothetical protein
MWAKSGAGLDGEASSPSFRCARDEPLSDAPLGDTRFRALLGDSDWTALSPAVRRRFSRRLAEGRTAIYVGEVLEAWTSRAGWLMVQALRLIGGPLPTSRDAKVPSVVTVTEDLASGGQVWTRLYVRRRGFPQVIHSSKRFAGPTGLEEHVGCGVGMTLIVRVEDRALVFRSCRYFVDLGRWRLNLPQWATPGALTVRHIEADGGRFVFAMEIVHPQLGVLVRQSAIFQETAP